MTTLKGPEVNNGLITNWIPLTTPGPSSLAVCSSALYFMPGAVSQIIAFDPYYGKWIDPQVLCLAKEQSAWWQQHSDGVTTDINLGPFACPTGYTTAATSSIDAVSTFVGCCPSLYTYQGTLLPAATLGQCKSPVTPGQTVVAKSTVSGFTWYDTTVIMPAPTSPASITGVHVNGFVFNLAGSSPVPTSATTTQGSATSATSSSVVNTSTPSPSPSASFPSSPPKQSGLSSGAKVGIGIGAGVVILGIIGVVATLFFLKRRSRTPSDTRRSVQPQIAEAPGDHAHPPNWDFTSAKTPQSPYTYAEASGEPKKMNAGPSEMWVSPSQGG